ncbi:Zinc finger PHD-finger [Penicillium bovifimosum]|uniref:Zinc finger PHD-finger n=1 Tax=Penicillium bovifimosum TaxID=126998 RepID=A0A9W9GKB6_9EURO|nr:Zinc finger PHD-finger [Penicillium bovifimosum]KAJ5121347.1 Zinc finger PHD-finger [Penicillium bovifimosum]
MFTNSNGQVIRCAKCGSRTYGNLCLRRPNPLPQRNKRRSKLLEQILNLRSLLLILLFHPKRRNLLSPPPRRPIVKCDYCACHWHVDCLPPPRAAPANPRKGWLCPNHVPSADMVSKNAFEDEVRPRRVRRPRNMALLDCDVIVPDDPDDSPFDEAGVPTGGVVLSFISAVKQDHAERERLKQKQELKRKCLDLTRRVTAEFFSTSGAGHLGSGPPGALTKKVGSRSRTLPQKKPK